MSLQMLSWLSGPAQLVNSLALFLGFMGGWLLIATRLRQNRRLASLSAPVDELLTPRMDRFFNGTGSACLAAALLVSWLSTRL